MARDDTDPITGIVESKSDPRAYIDTKDLIALIWAAYRLIMPSVITVAVGLVLAAYLLAEFVLR